MNSILNKKLPDELVEYQANIQATIQPFVEIKAKAESSLLLWQSKFGGFPYLPRGVPYPKDAIKNINPGKNQP